MWTNSQASQASHPFSVEPAEVGDRRGPADRRHVAEIAIAERPQRLLLERAQDVGDGVASHLDRDLRDAGQRPAVVAGQRREVADDEDVRRARDREVRLNQHAAGAIERHAERRAERRRRHARRPQHRLRCDRRRRPPRRVPATRRSRSSSVRTSTPSRCRSRSAAARRSSGNALRIDGPPSSSRILRGAGIEMPEVAGQRLSRDLGERSRHLDAGRPAADHDEGQQRRPLRRIALALGALERQQHPPPDLEGILERLQARRDRPPLVVSEVRVRRAGGDDQEVVVERAVGQEQAIALEVDADGLARAAPRRSSAGAESSGSARRCRPARAPPSPPGRAAAGTHDGCADRRA